MASKIISILLVSVLVLLCVGLFSFGAAAIDIDSVENDNGILILDSDNFDEIIDQEKFVMIEFYAPWCGHCKKMVPEYIEVAWELAAKPEEFDGARVAKIDCDAHKDACGVFGVSGYPTLKLFRHGIPIDYLGGRESDEILAFLRKKTQPPVTLLKSKDELASFIDSNEVVVVGHFTDESAIGYQNLDKAAPLFEQIRFGASIGENSLLEDIPSSEDGIVLFKKFDERKAVYSGDLSYNSITAFLTAMSPRLLNDFLTNQKMFQLPIKKHIFLFIGAGEQEPSEEESAEYLRLFDIVREVAPEHRGKIIFSHVNASHPHSQRILEYFSVSTSPQIFYVDLADDKKKYQHTGDFDLESVRKFVSDAYEGNAKLFFKSEAPYEYSGKGVRTLVGSDHDSIVYDPNLIVFVEYYAPWCGHCKQLAPIWDELAAEYEEYGNLVIAKLDNTKNEVANLEIKGFPTLYMFPLGVDKKPKLYTNARDLKHFRTHLKDYLPKSEEEAATAETTNEASTSNNDEDETAEDL